MNHDIHLVNKEMKFLKKVEPSNMKELNETESKVNDCQLLINLYTAYIAQECVGKENWRL